MVFLYGPIKTQIIDAVPAIPICVAPAHDLVAAICEVALQTTGTDKLNGALPSFFTSRKPMVAVPNIGIIAAPSYAIAFTAIGVHVVGRHIKEAGVILREVGSKSANLNIHFLFPFRKFMLLSINYFVFLLYDTDSESTM